MKALRVGVATLAALAAAVALAQTADPAFHTSPECWPAPRLYHAGPPDAEISARLHLITAPPVRPPGEASISPNGAYRFWVRDPEMSQPGPWGTGLIVDSEREQHLALLIEDVCPADHTTLDQ